MFKELKENEEDELKELLYPEVEHYVYSVQEHTRVALDVKTLHSEWEECKTKLDHI